VKPAWGRAFTLGVEEELFLVDAETLDAVPLFSQAFPVPSERLKPELFECLVETTTPVCASADEVLVELRRRRIEVAQRVVSLGATVLASASHPFAVADGQPIVPGVRYEQLAAKLGPAVYRQLVCGLHVHVGMPTAETCLRALEGIVPWLPTLLALSANSPYIDGDEAGARSARAGRLSELDSVGAPPLLETWSDWEQATHGLDYTRLWWDARPHPRYGTLEVRIADQQTDVRRAAGLTALVQALAAAVVHAGHAPYDRRRYAVRRARAAAAQPDPAELEVLAVLVEPVARDLGGWELARLVLEEGQEAERQLSVGRASGVEEVARDAVARSLE
jgi:carboxylate-amine ligase